MKRQVLTQQTVRCPLEDRTASVTVRTDLGGPPSRRYRGVTACSLLAPTCFVAPARIAYFSDVAPPVPHLCGSDAASRHALGVACPKRCLAILNAAAVGPTAAVDCTSGVSDSLELARQTQSLAVMRSLWLNSV
jgi:hypothetical protein